MISRLPIEVILDNDNEDASADALLPDFVRSYMQHEVFGGKTPDEAIEEATAKVMLAKIQFTEAAAKVRRLKALANGEIVGIEKLKHERYAADVDRMNSGRHFEREELLRMHKAVSNWVASTPCLQKYRAPMMTYLMTKINDRLPILKAPYKYESAVDILVRYEDEESKAKLRVDAAMAELNDIMNIATALKTNIRE